MFKFHYEHSKRDLRNMFFSTSNCNSFDIYKYYLSRCLCTYQNIYIRVYKFVVFCKKVKSRLSLEFIILICDVSVPFPVHVSSTGVVQNKFRRVMTDSLLVLFYDFHRPELYTKCTLFFV